MFGSLGFSELVIILVIALIILGPRKFPEPGRSLGKPMVEFKKATNEFQSRMDEEITREAQPKPPEISASASSAPAAPSATEPTKTAVHG